MCDQAALDRDDDANSLLAQAVGDEPTPEFAAQVVEQLDQVMDLLDDPTHRVMALWKLEGRTNPELPGISTVPLTPWSASCD